MIFFVKAFIFHNYKFCPSFNVLPVCIIRSYRFRKPKPYTLIDWHPTRVQQGNHKQLGSNFEGLLNSTRHIIGMSA